VGLVLLQAINRMHHPLKLRPVNQIKRALFPGKHIQRYLARLRNHLRRILGRQISPCDRFQRNMHQDAQPAYAAALFVNLLLRGLNRGVFHKLTMATGKPVWT
jgi:hypothetical protein